MKGDLLKVFLENRPKPLKMLLEWAKEIAELNREYALKAQQNNGCARIIRRGDKERVVSYVV